MSRACSDGDPEIVFALPHPQSAPSETDEKNTVFCKLCSAEDAERDDVITAAGEKLVAAVARRALPTITFLLMACKTAPLKSLSSEKRNTYDEADEVD